MNALKKRNNKIRDFFAKEYRNMVTFVKSYLNERYYGVYAEDIIQDVAESMISKLDFDQGIENFAGYIYRSLRNRVIDIQRKPKRDQRLDDYVDEEEENYIIKTFPVELLDDSKQVDWDRFYELFFEGLKELNPDQQAIIVETELEGASFEELSEKWGIPIGTLASRKNRATRKLRSIIDVEEFIKDNN